MEDLLASIRKAINEDIGPEGGQTKARMPARGSAQIAEEQSSTSAEIQQLREKITRSRSGEPAASRDPAQRAASLAAALRSQTPRRSWREIEPTLPPPPAPAPQQPAPRLRTSIIDPEVPRPPLRPEPVPAARPASRFLDRQTQPQQQPAQPAWPTETTSVAVPREPERGAMPANAAILSGESAQAVQSAFGKLAESVLARAIGEQSIEDMTRDLLKVMLKQWLDDNLPAIVERLVREEIERVARTGR